MLIAVHMMARNESSYRLLHVFVALVAQMDEIAQTDADKSAMQMILRAYGHLRRFALVHLSPSKTTSREAYIKEVEASMEELYNFACIAEEVRVCMCVVKAQRKAYTGKVPRDSNSL